MSDALTIDDVMRHLGGAREHGTDAHRALVAGLARALETVLTDRPLWCEASTAPSFDGDALTEVRVIGRGSLVTITATAHDPFAGVGPLVQVRSLGDVSGVDLDRFVLAEDASAVGCSITLLFDRGESVRLGGSGDEARQALMVLLPDLMARIRGLHVTSS